MNPKSEHQYQVGFYNSIQELGIKTKQSKSDLDQLHQLLNFILCYPSLKQAKIHHNANTLGCNDLLTKQKQIEDEVRKQKISNFKTCPCCGVLVQNQKLEYFMDLQKLNLGLGVYLFFKNYFFHAVVFFIMFLVYSIYSLATNVKIFNQNNNVNSLCFLTSTACGLSQIGAGAKVLNQDDYVNKLSKIQAWIGVAFVGLWGILYMLKTYFEEKFIIGMEEKRISASDFTLMLTHIPRQYFIDRSEEKKRVDEGKKSVQQNLESIMVNRESNWLTKSKFKQRSSELCYLSNQQITQKFNKQMMDYGRRINSLVAYQVVKINIAKPLYQITKEVQEEKAKVNKVLYKKLDVFRGFVKQRQKSVQFKTPSAKRNQYYEDYMKFYSGEFQRHNEKEVDYADSNIVFVTFRSSTARKQIQERNRPSSIFNIWNFFRKQDFPIPNVKVRKAPQPEQIKWDSIGFPKSQKRIRRAFMWLLTILLIGISLGISIGIAFINRQNLNVGISVGISIVVTAVNLGIQIVIAYTSYYQNEYISSREQYNIALKIGFAQLVNSIGVPIVVTLISQSRTAMKEKPWVKAGGVVDDVFFIALLNILVPIGLFLDPWEQFLRLKRWYYSSPQQRLRIHTQKQLNSLYGNYVFDIGYEYAYLIKTCIFTSFFVCMQPIISIFAPIGLILYYLSTKRNLLYHFSRPNYHSSTINSVVDSMLLLSLLGFGFGNLMVNNFIKSELQNEKNGTLVANWIIVIVAAVFVVIVPLRAFYCCLKKPQLAQHDYLEKRMILNTDYDRLNPQTRNTAVYEFRDYLNKIQEKNGLPDEAEFIKLAIDKEIQQRQKQQVSHQLIASKLRTTKNIPSGVQKDGGIGVDSIQPVYNHDLNQYKKIVQDLGKSNANDQNMRHSGISLKFSGTKQDKNQQKQSQSKISSQNLKKKKEQPKDSPSMAPLNLHSESHMTGKSDGKFDGNI